MRLPPRKMNTSRGKWRVVLIDVYQPTDRSHAGIPADSSLLIAPTRWYLHPMQHAAEMLLALAIFGPLLMLTYKQMVDQMRANK